MPCMDGGPPCGSSDDTQERLDKVTRLLCTLANATEDMGYGMINDFGLSKREKAEITEWLAEHNEADRKRLAREEKAKKQKDLKKNALAKLTAAEKKALGLG